ncbi:MAG: ABC transporter ATP-binding protein [Phycisphaerae bacterium]|nr:ABC transporter ATP-binding protein [Phycisphaerae bacterium]
MTSDAPVIAVEGLRFRYGGAGEAFSLEVPELTIGVGEHTALIGPSGCGKTTLLRLLIGSLTPDTGEVCVLGERVSLMGEGARRRVRRRNIGMVFQGFALLDYLTAHQNITLPRRLDPSLMSARDADARARSLAERAGIAGLLDRRPGRLSQGERQRVAICRALLASPALIACDEPTGNLDPARSAGVVDLIMDEAEAIGSTVLFVTHDHGLLGRFGRVVELDKLTTMATGAVS